MEIVVDTRNAYNTVNYWINNAKNDIYCYGLCITDINSKTANVRALIFQKYNLKK